VKSFLDQFYFISINFQDVISSSVLATTLSMCNVGVIKFLFCSVFRFLYFLSASFSFILFPRFFLLFFFILLPRFFVFFFFIRAFSSSFSSSSFQDFLLLIFVNFAKINYETYLCHFNRSRCSSACFSRDRFPLLLHFGLFLSVLVITLWSFFRVFFLGPFSSSFTLRPLFKRFSGHVETTSTRK